MARCDVPGCKWRGKAAGKAIHMARVHDIHPNHNDEIPTHEEPKDPLDILLEELEDGFKNE